MKREKKIREELRKLMMEHRVKVLELIDSEDEIREDSREARDLMGSLFEEVERINNKINMNDYSLEDIEDRKERR